MIHRIINRTIAKCRSHKHNKAAHQKLCALVVKGNKVISVGYNKVGTHPIVEKFKTNNNVDTIHAEIDAVLRAKNKIGDLTGCTVFIARVKWADKPEHPSIGLSKCCDMCHDVLRSLGIKKVVYTLDNQAGSYDMMTITDRK